jgi:hypothetical protein
MPMAAFTMPTIAATTPAPTPQPTGSVTRRAVLTTTALAATVLAVPGCGHPPRNRPAQTDKVTFVTGLGTNGRDG